MREPGRGLERWLRDAWQGPATPLARAGLGAAAAAYRVALAARSASYAAGLLSTRRLPVPVISVGNVTMGGSGKTPLAEYVVLALTELGARPALISRGYGRRTRGVRIVADCAALRLGARDGGDEPVMLAERLPGVPVVVGESRYDAGAAAIESCGAGALVLDDGFQHRTLAKDLEIVAVSGTDPWGSGRLFPSGALREPLSALRRADLIVVTNPLAPAATSAVADTVRRWNRDARLVSGSYRPSALRLPDHAMAQAPEAVAGRKVLALAGLASPSGFVATARRLGADVAGLVEVPDHHWYTAADLARVVRRARELGAEAVLTTEKDWVRLRELPPGDVPVWVLSVRLDLGADRSVLLQTLAETLRRTAEARRVP